MFYTRSRAKHVFCSLPYETNEILIRKRRIESQIKNKSKIKRANNIEKKTKAAATTPKRKRNENVCHINTMNSLSLFSFHFILDRVELLNVFSSLSIDLRLERISIVNKT